MKTRLTVALLTLGLAQFPLTSALADDLPPANAKPLSAILTAVEQQNLGAVAEAEFDNGRWEVTACHDGACQKLEFNALTGEKESQRNTEREKTPSAASTPIATLVQRIEAAQTGVVTSIDFEHGHWNIELVVTP